MTETLRRLVRIEATVGGAYLVTLADGDDQRTYEFTVSSGDIAAIEASPEFSQDVGAFGYSHLVYKAVSAFHDAHQHAVGRPSDPA